MTLFPDAPPRDPEDLLASGLAVIDAAFAAGAVCMSPLFSGGHDSIGACHVASKHPRFAGEVHHFDTGIGARRTRDHVERTCHDLGWHLRVWRSNTSFEEYVRHNGFPGPGGHRYTYARLKERCVRQLTKGAGNMALINGGRRDESTRRMGHTDPLVIGERSFRTGKVYNRRRFWVSPCYDWTAVEQAAYMEAFDLPRNPLKIALGMSGECFCGAFASPGELDRIREHAPDVAAEIDRLADVARSCGKHAVWGTRPPAEPKGVAVAETGPLCTSCDRRAWAAGVLFRPID